MRELGTLPDRTQAERLVDYLVANGMLSSAETKGQEWAVWIRDEDHVAEAQAAFAKFRANPDDPAFDGHKSQAEAVRREREEKLERARENTRDAQALWQRPALDRLPVTLGLILISIAVTYAANFGQRPTDEEGKATGPFASTVRWVAFYDPHYSVPPGTPHPGPFVNILQGQVWRLVTPIFLHFSVMHILFNMFWLYRIGSVLEHRRGSWWLAGFVLGSAVISNCAEEVFGGPSVLGGFSGVNYALFGFALIQSYFFRDLGFELDQFTIWIMLGWMGIGFTGQLNGLIGGQMGNWAHLGGFVVGCAIAYLPHVFRRGR